MKNILNGEKNLKFEIIFQSQLALEILFGRNET